tara:strand:+ start:290 stop:580 length:291 start_codon:yes stop_codon:yes gene_type:complete
LLVIYTYIKYLESERIEECFIRYSHVELHDWGSGHDEKVQPQSGEDDIESALIDQQISNTRRSEILSGGGWGIIEEEGCTRRKRTTKHANFALLSS